MTEEMKIIGSKAKEASRLLINIGSFKKKEMLYKMAEFLKNEAFIFSLNTSLSSSN